MRFKFGLASLLLSLLLLFSLTFALPVTAASSQYVTKGNTTSKVVALTFDDGADGKNITKILQILTTNKIKATFFITGKAAENHPQLIKTIVSQGHEIGNHSYSHPDFTKMTATQIKTELDKADAAIKKASGKSTKPYFRAPFGSVNTATLLAVGNLGYTKTIGWTIDTVDWKGISSTEITNKVVNNATPGMIVLMHAGEGAPGTPGALQTMINQLKAKGYTFVTVGQLLTTPPTKVSSGQHIVKPGDTLTKIAALYGVIVQQLATANKLTNTNLIRVGQLLTIPTTNYTVKAGDTLIKIAQAHKVTVQQLVAINQLSNPNILKIGQVLKIPAKASTPTIPNPVPTTTNYTVKSGDTLYSIAKKYGITVQQIVTANKLANANVIKVGQVLKIPTK
ncbi:putative polysaccharide deacetylase [Carnobacterium sp. 17-4]|uniref:LysM peptidoglycan-binding domain-containing protein n=1 Tax=Carnobacterium sp. (strain 17-4) TaxID=208596 RepID=UPI0002059229|nr:LysM peptidoglycan-binding domain-containing protein [Carnobacterium sp. 17-4]AEB29783.1 putative polysaccharide deacetylase [Carnobacterium sp. 17-4]